MGENDPYPFDGIVLFDVIPKPDYRKGEQIYPSDPFSGILEDLRKKGKIRSSKKIPLGSRFDISWDEINQHVFPRIAETLNIDAALVRFPKQMEYLCALLVCPVLTQGDTWEWFQDRAGFGARITACFDNGHMEKLPYIRTSSRKKDNLGFRPMILIS